MNPTPPSVATKRTPIETVFERVNYERRAIEDGSEFKLDTIRQILARLGNPHLKLNVVHIAGTKGKGSTAHFVSRIGSELGLKTAIYSSPHFERYNERFVVDNQEISDAVLNPVLAKVLAIVDSLDEEIQNGLSSLRPATFFDISTATAFLLFHELNVELVALEVGLGGRLDSTNVCQAMASIVTNISLDHTKQLGSTTTQIAAEKAAIIKSSVPAICGDVEKPVYEVIQKQAIQSDAKLTRMGYQFGVDPSSFRIHESEIVFDFCDFQTQERFRDLKISSLAKHQAHNACLAIETIRRIVHQLDVKVDLETAIRRGLQKTQLTGRLEVVRTRPCIVVDMAHNEASIGAMINSLSAFNINGKSQAVFSCAKDKDHRAMLPLMLRFFDRILLTEFEKNPRSQSAEFLLDEATSMMNDDVENLSTELISIPSPKNALENALNLCGTEDLIVICGSVFLVGELLPLVR